MDESEGILLSSLRSSGITLPSNISSLKDLTPDSLFSICAQFLHRIDAASPSFPATLPPATADRFKTCEEMASAIKALGYTASLGFHQFLYPSDEDAHKLVRFLVVKLSESSEPNRGLTDDVNEPLHIEASGNIDEARKTQEKKKTDVGGNSQRNQENRLPTVNEPETDLHTNSQQSSGGTALGSVPRPLRRSSQHRQVEGRKDRTRLGAQRL